MSDDTSNEAPKKRGRPPGSKTKPKEPPQRTMYPKRQGRLPEPPKKTLIEELNETFGELHPEDEAAATQQFELVRHWAVADFMASPRHRSAIEVLAMTGYSKGSPNKGSVPAAARAAKTNRATVAKWLSISTFGECVELVKNEIIVESMDHLRGMARSKNVLAALALLKNMNPEVFDDTLRREREKRDHELRLQQQKFDHEERMLKLKLEAGLREGAELARPVFEYIETKPGDRLVGSDESGVALLISEATSQEPPEH